MKEASLFGKFIEFLGKIPQLFDWYFGLAPTKRMNFNYITIITVLVIAGYWNDHKHSENYTALSKRIDDSYNLRAQDQERYTVSLEKYTDKFNLLLEKLIEQKKEVIQLKQEVQK